VAGSADTWFQQTECLPEPAQSATVHVRLRFLQLQHRSVEQRLPDGSFQPVDGLELDGQRYLSFDEAVPREFDIAAELSELHQAGDPVRIEVPGGEDVEP
jgi:hypothetical protein